ncbi:MAG: LPS export ABC transporter periplasmic protein LptC [Cypionkella sp.]|nr:LPS export ABC transporter periplasmic protein LptC [Cypionkella sp.]
MATMNKPDTHSRLIAFLKVALPLLALALLSSLFLLSRSINPEDAIPYSEVDVEDRLREPRMTQPAYAGVTEDGAALTLSAGELRPRPDDPRSAKALGLVGALETPDGRKTDLSAGQAELEAELGEILLSGGVEIRQATGWTVTTDSMTLRTDRTSLTATTPVAAEGPAGRITANGMNLTQNPEGSGGYVLVFNGAVKLLYQPGK